MRADASAIVLLCLLGNAGLPAAQEAPRLSQLPPPAPSSTAPQDFELRAAPIALPKGWTMRFDMPDACPSCGGERGGPLVVNGNAPWRMSGTLSFAGDRSSLDVTVTGQRGARLPAYMTPAMGGARPAAASEALLSDTVTRWQLSVEGERRLFGRADGVSLSVVGSGHLPLATSGRSFTPDGGAAALGREPTISSRAAFGGLRVRF